MPQPSRDVQVGYEADDPLVPPGSVRDAVLTVLDGEAAGPAEISVTFVAPHRMRDLNRETFGRARETDVIAFTLPHPGVLVGDVYVCPDVARATAGATGETPSDECLRLVVHGTLHVLGYDHPEGEHRTLSLMWKLQERYLRRLRQVAE